ncbi:hypothetical protein [Amycolatopsis jiangsuensis]|uniref:Uncharacterized protein n=1 Tax=Amycolatopsis jiangsuensis TaxID=1181879 RepID=A0A840J6W8_9PSEU|nr:hypothetical protein [Amycolatopsis jiangsuensis]MBB4689459.1 hypothetical protein [Amycolatopsis jiangsuensis]
METSRHNRPGPSAPADGRPAVAGGGTLADLGRLIARAEALHLRAPELALVLGERAAALAEAAGADGHWVRAESLVVSARVRVGDRTGTVGRAVAALRAAEHAGYVSTAARLRIDLAVCARSLGVPLMGLAALRPALSKDVLPSLRAEAFCHLVGCLAQFGRKPELDRVLVEADKLLVADDALDADTRLLLRALLRNGTAAHRRRHGDLTAAADAARTGLGFLEKLDRPGDDGGLVRTRLVLQLVSTLLDRGDADMAYDIAEPVLRAPVRAAGVAPSAWLRLAVATRVHLPAGSGEAAAELVREAVAATDRHGLPAVTSRLWLELSQIEERFGSAEEAIACLHRSRAAEHVHARARRQACGLLAGEFGASELASFDLDEVLAASGPRDSRAVPMAVEPRVEAEVTSVMPAIRDEPPAEKAEKAPAWSFGRPTEEIEQTAVLPAVSSQPEAAPRARKPAALPAWGRPFRRDDAQSRRTGETRRTHQTPSATEVEKPASRATERRRAREAAEVHTVESAPAQTAPRDAGTSAVRGKPAARVDEPAVSSVRAEEAAWAEKAAQAEEAAWAQNAARAEEAAWAEKVARAQEAARAEKPVRTEETARAGKPAEAVARESARESVPQEPPRFSLRMPDLSDILPELPLAPAPADEPAAPLWESDEWAREEQARRDVRSRTTRHDAEHGSVAARSVLDRLGISAGEGGGGRRRADEPGPRAAESDPGQTEPGESEPAESGRGKTGSGEAEADPANRPAATTVEYLPKAAEPRLEEPVADPWLPRLRMPPALDPLTDVDDWTPSSQPFPESYARAIAEDEPAADAGLAELLARALAEHQAGTASAAALVKQLGPQDEPKRPVNGHATADRHRTTD